MFEFSIFKFWKHFILINFAILVMHCSQLAFISGQIPQHFQRVFLLCQILEYLRRNL